MKHKTNTILVKKQEAYQGTVKAFCAKISISQQYYYQIKREIVEVSNSALKKYMLKLS